MAPYSDQSKRWREQNQESIRQWQAEIADLRHLGNLENWTAERLEIEIAQKLDADLRTIWDFASRYSRRYKKSKLGQFFKKALVEIIDYGIIEPSRKKHLLRSIETTRRKMNARK
jgi:hypothetical protein